MILALERISIRLAEIIISDFPAIAFSLCLFFFNVLSIPELLVSTIER